MNTPDPTPTPAQAKAPVEERHYKLADSLMSSGIISSASGSNGHALLVEGAQEIANSEAEATAELKVENANLRAELACYGWPHDLPTTKSGPTMKEQNEQLRAEAKAAMDALLCNPECEKLFNEFVSTTVAAATAELRTALTDAEENVGRYKQDLATATGGKWAQWSLDLAKAQQESAELKAEVGEWSREAYAASSRAAISLGELQAKLTAAESQVQRLRDEIGAAITTIYGHTWGHYDVYSIAKKLDAALAASAPQPAQEQKQEAGP